MQVEISVFNIPNTPSTQKAGWNQWIWWVLGGFVVAEKRSRAAGGGGKRSSICKWGTHKSHGLWWFCHVLPTKIARLYKGIFRRLVLHHRALFSHSHLSMGYLVIENGLLPVIQDRKAVKSSALGPFNHISSHPFTFSSGPKGPPIDPRNPMAPGPLTFSSIPPTKRVMRTVGLSKYLLKVVMPVRCIERLKHPYRSTRYISMRLRSTDSYGHAAHGATKPWAIAHCPVS